MATAPTYPPPSPPTGGTIGNQHEHHQYHEPSRQRRHTGSAFVDFLLFRRMIAPWVIQVLFWLAVVGVIVWGLIFIISGVAIFLAGAGQRDAQLASSGAFAGFLFILYGFATMVIGPLLIRLYAEAMIVIFRISETLLDILAELKRRSGPLD